MRRPPKRPVRKTIITKLEEFPEKDILTFTEELEKQGIHPQKVYLQVDYDDFWFETREPEPEIDFQHRLGKYYAKLQDYEDWEKANKNNIEKWKKKRYGR